MRPPLQPPNHEVVRKVEAHWKPRFPTSARADASATTPRTASATAERSPPVAEGSGRGSWNGSAGGTAGPAHTKHLSTTPPDYVYHHRQHRLRAVNDLQASDFTDMVWGNRNDLRSRDQMDGGVEGVHLCSGRQGPCRRW